MHQLRWNALLSQWVVVTTERQNRPQMPSNWCPFDPGSGRVPDSYEVFLYPNDFPAFSPTADPFTPDTDLLSETGPRGACDVVLYSPEHTLPPSKLSLDQWRSVVDLWTARTRQHAANPDIALIAIFENCGEAVGVTMPHPHGQIYAFPFIPPVVQKELESAREFAAAHAGDCLFCRLMEEEVKRVTRVVAADQHFVAFVPYAARFPAEIALYPRRHVRSLLELTEEEKTSLAHSISIVRQKYDNLYGFLMPLMMPLKQGPLREGDPPYHFHLEFLPLQRSPTKLKYMATIETAYGTFLADTAPEQMAETLRNTEPVTKSLVQSCSGTRDRSENRA
ncbi:MAG: galactose-1-phosphate uridylyltransferase [Acidobacteriaceae bacterium]|nr:galactose-1-phosphate uridylyltransferase [Acidobacteriaceae bacterium]